MLLFIAHSGSQGTWRFIAAELIDDPNTPHSFVHDLESAYYILLNHSVHYMEHSWTLARVSNFIKDTLDLRRYDGEGGLQKLHFIVARFGLGSNPFNIPENQPLMALLKNLYEKHMSRYQTPNLPDKRLPSFVAHEIYMENEFRHQVFIDMMDDALNSPSWPNNDHPMP